MHFSQESLDFLFKNRLNDNRMWFKEHKDEYTRLVEEPMKELSMALLPVVREIDEKIEHMHISRIYRDARFARNKGVFRENMWCSYGRTRELFKSLPAFYIDISAAGFEYGCGYYNASAESMEIMRDMITGGSPLFAAADAALEKSSVFELYGDMYKRDHYPNECERNRQWLNRKTIGVTALCKDWQVIFSDDLWKIAAENFREIVPIYHFLLAAG